MFARLQSASDKTTVTFKAFAKLRPLLLSPISTQIRATDLEVRPYLTTSLATYENPKLMAVWGNTFSTFSGASLKANSILVRDLKRIPLTYEVARGTNSSIATSNP